MGLTAKQTSPHVEKSTRSVTPCAREGAPRAQVARLCKCMREAPNAGRKVPHATRKFAQSSRKARRFAAVAPSLACNRVHFAFAKRFALRASFACLRWGYLRGGPAVGLHAQHTTLRVWA